METEKEKLKAFKEAVKLVEDGCAKLKQAAQIVEPYASQEQDISAPDLDWALTHILRLWEGNQSYNVAGDNGVEEDFNNIMRLNNKLNQEE